MRMTLPVRERRRESTRLEIVEAAWGLVRENGVAGLMMRDLGVRTGMTAPALYRYFGSKFDIYDALFADGHRQLQAHLACERRPDDGPEVVFRRGAHSMMEFCASDAARYALLFQRPVPGFEPSDESMSLARDSYEHLLSDLAALGVTDQPLVDLWAAVHMGLTAQQLANDPGGDRWAELVDDAVDMFLAYIGAPLARGGRRGNQARRSGRRAGGGGAQARR